MIHFSLTVLIAFSSFVLLSFIVHIPHMFSSFLLSLHLDVHHFHVCRHLHNSQNWSSTQVVSVACSTLCTRPQLMMEKKKTRAAQETAHLILTHEHYQTVRQSQNRRTGAVCGETGNNKTSDTDVQFLTQNEDKKEPHTLSCTENQKLNRTHDCDFHLQLYASRELGQRLAGRNDVKCFALDVKRAYCQTNHQKTSTNT